MIWVENESVKIGNITLPEGLWSKMNKSPRVHIEASLEDRVKYILEVKFMIYKNERKYFTFRTINISALKIIGMFWKNKYQNLKSTLARLLLRNSLDYRKKSIMKNL